MTKLTEIRKMATSGTITLKGISAELRERNDLINLLGSAGPVQQLRQEIRELHAIKHKIQPE